MGPRQGEGPGGGWSGSRGRSTGRTSASSSRSPPSLSSGLGSSSLTAGVEGVALGTSSSMGADARSDRSSTVPRSSSEACSTLTSMVSLLLLGLLCFLLLERDRSLSRFLCLVSFRCLLFDALVLLSRPSPLGSRVRALSVDGPFEVDDALGAAVKPGRFSSCSLFTGWPSPFKVPRRTGSGTTAGGAATPGFKGGGAVPPLSSCPVSPPLTTVLQGSPNQAQLSSGVLQESRVCWIPANALTQAPQGTADSTRTGNQMSPGSVHSLLSRNFGKRVFMRFSSLLPGAKQHLIISIIFISFKKLDDGWPESEKGKDVDVKYIEERRRCEKISEERMNIWCRWRCDMRKK